MKLPNFLKNRKNRLSRPAQSLFGQNRRIRINLRLLNGLGILILVLFTVYFFLRSDFFLVRNLEIDPGDSVLIDRGKVTNFLSTYLNSSIFSLRTAEIEDDLRASFFEMNMIRVEKHLPDTILLSYDEKKPIIKVKKADEVYLVDNNGFVFSQITDSYEELPEMQIEGFDDGKVLGRSLALNQIESVLEIASFNWEQLGVNLKEINYQSNIVELKLQGFKVIFNLEKNVSEQLTEGELIIKNTQSQGKQLALIDLRFDRPVIRYQ